MCDNLKKMINTYNESKLHETLKKIYALESNGMMEVKLDDTPWICDILDENGNEQGLNDDSYYWTANGLILINNGGSGTVKPVTIDESIDVRDYGASVRCVYDEWFWGDATEREVAKNTFTWGDVNY